LEYRNGDLRLAEPSDRREKWIIGYEKRSAAGGLISDQCYLYKNRSIPPNPLFQYSMAFDYGNPIVDGTYLAQRIRYSVLE